MRWDKRWLWDEESFDVNVPPFLDWREPDECLTERISDFDYVINYCYYCYLWPSWGIFFIAIIVNNHPLKLFTWGPDARRLYCIYTWNEKSSNIIDKLMSECANLFCRNVYSNISTQNNIALTLCWKTTKKYKAQYVLFDQPARRPVTQPHRSEERFWPSASICGFPSFNSPENVVPSRFFVF